MLIHELTDEECRGLLESATLGYLACARANQPYVVPVSLAYAKDRHSMFGASPVGRKITWMRKNPRVCVAITDVRDRFYWTTVIIEGRYEEIPPTNRYQQERQEALSLFRSRSKWWLPALGKVVGRSEQQSLVVYRIRIDAMSGRRVKRPSKSS